MCNSSLETGDKPVLLVPSLMKIASLAFVQERKRVRSTHAALEGTVVAGVVLMNMQRDAMMLAFLEVVFSRCIRLGIAWVTGDRPPAAIPPSGCFHRHVLLL